MASSINDNILQATGGPSINDGLATWYGKQPTRSLPDAERGWLTQRPYTINNASINDMWFNFLRADGYTGSLQDMLKAYWAAPSRVIPTLAGSQYGTIDTQITFTGDFEVEVEFASTNVSATRVIAGGSSGRPIVQLNSTTGLLTYHFNDSVPASVSLQIPTINWADGKIHTGKVSRVGDLFTLECEGNIVSATHVGAVSQTWDKIGTYSVSTNPFNGQLLSTKFTEAGTVVADFVFDSGSTTDQLSRGGGNNVTLVNFATTDWNRYTLQRNITHDAGVIAEAWVGDNKVVNGTFDADTDWTKGAGWSIGSGIASITVSAATNSIYQSNIVDNASIYLMKVNQVSIPANSFNFQVGGTLLAISTDLGVHKGVITAGASAVTGISCNSAGTTGSIDDVSVQHLLEVA